MNFTYQKIIATAALLISFAVGQAYINISLALTSSEAPVSKRSRLFGLLTTSDDKPITVNGAAAITGASIPSGAIIETPQGVGATVRLWQLGTLCIAEKSKLTLEFDEFGKSVNITLTEGCVVLRTPEKVAAAINSPEGQIASINASYGGSLDVCLKPGAPPSVNRGAALDAGAGSSTFDCGTAGAAAIPPAFPSLTVASFIAGEASAIYIGTRGENPSPSAP